MGNFNRGGGFGGGNRGGGGGSRFGGGRDSGRPSFRREDRGPVTMTKVTCDECKKPCEVPFRPTAGKPVYCNECFRSQGGAGQDRTPRRDFGDRPARPNFGGNEGGGDVKKQLESINSKLDKLIVSIENLSAFKSAVKNEVAKSMTVSIPKKEVKKETKKKAMKK
jgi:DNA-directed RNA polymerase